MHEEPPDPLIKEVPGHLFTFEEKIWGLTLPQLLTDLGALTGSITLTGSLALLLRIVVCTVLTLLVILLVHGKAQGHPLGFWLYLYVRFKTMPARTTWQPRGALSSPQVAPRGKRLPSVQATWIPVDSYEQGVMGQHEQRKQAEVARYWTVLEVEGRNVRLLLQHEQVRIFRRFETFLTGLEFHLQFLSFTEQIDPRTAPPMLIQHEALASLAATPHLQAFQRASLQVQEQQMSVCTRTRHFVVVSASAAEAALRSPDGTARSPLTLLWRMATLQRPPAVSRTEVLDQLRIRTSVVTKALQQVDLRVLPLKDEHLLQLFAHCLAPGASLPTFVPELLAEPALPAPLAGQPEAKRPGAPTSGTAEPMPSQGTKARTQAAHSRTNPPAAVSSSASGQRSRAAGTAQHAGQKHTKQYRKRISGLHGTFHYTSLNEQGRFEAGVLDVADLLAPSRVEVRPDVIEVHARNQLRYLRTFTVTGYGHHLLCGWVNDLADLGLPMLISSHFEPMDSRFMVTKLEQHLTKLESQRLADQKTLRITKADQSIEAEQIRHVSRALASKRLKIFDVSMTICIHAGSLERLEQRSRYLLSHLRDMHIQARPAIRQQDQAWQACLPVSLDILQNWSKLPSDVAATFLPGASGVIGTPTGAFLGVTGSGLARRPVYFNPWSRDKKVPNPHVVIIGESGMGKSWLGKTMVTGLLGLGIADVVVLDKDDDYLPLHEKLHGESQRYNLARGCPINLFDLPFGPQDVDPDDPADLLAEFCDNVLLTGLALLVTDDETRLSKSEEAYLMQVARATYASKGITSEAICRDPTTLLRPAPTLTDFIERMKSIPASAEGMRQSLLERLEKASYLFQGGQTSIAIDKPLTIFSIKEMDDKWYALMTYAVQNFLMRHRALKRDERYLAYVVEEASYLLRHPAGRRYLESASRGFRKLGIALITLSQHPRDFLEAGQVVLSNAGTVFFLGMERTAAEKLHLAEELERMIVDGIPGQCVMRVGNEYAPLMVWSNPVYRALFTTDPAERRAIRQKKRGRAVELTGGIVG